MLHAIALSDGLEGKGAELSRSFEVIRERERLDKATDNLKRLLARRAVLRSERDSNQPADTRGVEEIAGREGAATLMASVIGERQLLIASREAQRTALSATIASAEKELQSLRSRMEHIGLGLKDRAERLDVLEQPAEQRDAQRLQRLPGAQRHGLRRGAGGRGAEGYWRRPSSSFRRPSRTR